MSMIYIQSHWWFKLNPLHVDSVWSLWFGFIFDAFWFSSRLFVMLWKPHTDILVWVNNCGCLSENRNAGGGRSLIMFSFFFFSHLPLLVNSVSGQEEWRERPVLREEKDKKRDGWVSESHRKCVITVEHTDLWRAAGVDGHTAPSVSCRRHGNEDRHPVTDKETKPCIKWKRCSYQIKMWIYIWK